MLARTTDSTRAWTRLRRFCQRFCVLAAWALSHGAGAAQPQHALPPLLEPAQLAALLQSGQVLRVLDLRDPDDWRSAHIAGSLSSPYDDWRGPMSNPGQLQPLPEYVATVRALGLQRTTPVVLVSDGGDPSDFGAPARVYWTLKWLGLQQLAILNGGVSAWREAGLPLTRKPSPAPCRSDFIPQLQPQLLTSSEQLQRQLRDPHAAAPLLLDARSSAFYQGQLKSPLAHSPGTLPGAHNFDNQNWFVADGGRLQDAAALRQLGAGVDPAGLAVVSFCNTGHLAATNWFVLSELLHRPQVSMYPGSMVDWTQDERPLDHVPSRLDQLLAQLKSTWNSL